MSLLSEVEPVQAVLSRPHGLLEAPRFGARGELVFSDVMAGGLWACDADGEVRELLAKRRGIGGALAHARGGWVVSGRTVLHLADDGGQREILTDGDGIFGYNDLGATPEGGLLAGALRFRPFAGEAEQPGQLIERAPDGSQLVLSEELTWPNGIGCSADGSTVYMSDYARGAVLAISRESGATSVFAESPRGSADGLALDSDGGVWVALGEGAGVARFEADGSLHEAIALPARFVSSLSFGGADMCDVLITTADNEVRPELGGTLLRARSEIAGQPLAAVKV